MLVISPNSTCDVCLEGYSSGSNIPHSITCGHVFCQKCLDRLMQSAQYKCPLCRAQLSPQDNRKLHVDCDPAVPGPPLTPENSAEPSTSPSPVEDKERRLLNELARVIREGAKIQEIRGLVDRCKTYYKSLPSDETNPVRISCLLLHHLADSQGKLQTQAKQLREAQATCDEIREHLTSAEHKYQELERTSRDEKEAALAIEKSLREHYDQMNSYWKGQLQTVERERRSLQEALDKARSSQPVAQPRSIEMRYFYSTEPRRPSHHSGDPLPHKKESPNGKVLDEDIDLHLSPLADASAPLASTVQSLRALSDESDEEDMRKNPAPMQEVQVDSEMEQSNVGTPMAYPLHQPAAADPIPIPSRTPLSRQASSVAMSVNSDYWPSGISSSRPRDDVVMSSRPPSPSRRHSSDRMALVHGQRPTDSHMREMELKDMKPKDSEPASKDQVATWRIISSGVSKLHDLLDSPQPSSLHTPRPQRSDYPEPTISRPTSRPSVPSRPSSTQYPSTSTSLSKYPDDPILTERRPLVRASDVAMQLERERLEKLEKERNRRRETPTTSSSLKDTTNAPVESHHHSQRHKHGNGKMKAVHSAPGATFA